MYACACCEMEFGSRQESNFWHLVKKHESVLQSAREALKDDRFHQAAALFSQAKALATCYRTPQELHRYIAVGCYGEVTEGAAVGLR